MILKECSYLVLIPSYNTGGALLQKTVELALRFWQPVWVVLDGSTDDSKAVLEELKKAYVQEQLQVLELPENQGKGGAICAALSSIAAAGFTHVLTMDADGQHDPSLIADMVKKSKENPEAMVLGRPIFGDEAPQIRLQGRKISNVIVRLESGQNIADALFGFRLYPVAALQAAFAETSSARHYDFEPEMAVRLSWQGVPVVNFDAPCRYLSKEEEGVSHFHYVRDNLRMIALHSKLLCLTLVRKVFVRS